MSSIDTAYRIFQPGDGAIARLTVQWPREPGYDLIRALVEPLLGGEHLEHVSVLHDGRRRDMFVAETGRLRTATREPLPRNERATAIYRANYLTRFPGTDPEKLEWIAGPAILFERRIWF